MFGEVELIVQEVVKLLLYTSKHKDDYYKSLQTVRLCFGMLLRWKNQEATGKIVANTLILDNALTLITSNHGGGDERIVGMIENLSR